MIKITYTKVIDGRVRTFDATGRAGETFTSRAFMQQYGFASMPLEGAEGVIVTNGNFIIAISSDDSRYRPGLQSGEAVLYDAFGSKVHLTQAAINAFHKKLIHAEAPDLELKGKVKIIGSLDVSEAITAGGNISDLKGSMAIMRQVHNMHVHPVQGVVTDVPTVQE